MVEERLRFAVVGIGKMGLVHSSILNVLPSVQLIALCEKNSMIRKFSRKLFKEISVVDDVTELREFGLDAVYVATPISSHFAITKALYSEKVARNVFVEKTLTQKFEESEELADLAESSGGANMVGYLRRFYVTFEKAKDLLSEDAIGEVSSFKAYAYSSDFYGTKMDAKAVASRGGVLRELGCYAVDLALWFFGELTVGSITSSTQAKADSLDSVDFEVKNADGLVGRLSASWRVPDYHIPEVGFSITGSEGEILVNDDRVELKQKGRDPLVWYRHDLGDNVPFWLGLPEYYREDAHFVESIVKDEDARPDFRCASKVDQILCQVEKEDGESH